MKWKRRTLERYTRYTDAEKRAAVEIIMRHLAKHPGTSTRPLLREMGLSSYAYVWMRDPLLGGDPKWSHYTPRATASTMMCPWCRKPLGLRKSSKYR